MSRFLGIDFSGNHNMWTPRCRRSNIWVATIVEKDGLCLDGLRRMQELPGAEHPFTRLTGYLKKGDFTAAAIDAPFSIPEKYISEAGHQGLLGTVAGIPLQGRPFPSGKSFVQAITGQEQALNPPKPLRHTERHWAEKGVNVRSTLWNGPRGGAPMTAACLSLLHWVDGPIWPWVQATSSGCLVEAFPAAQLRTWGLPYQGYNGSRANAAHVRSCINKRVSHWVTLGNYCQTLQDNADALDALLCAFSAIAVVSGQLAVRHPDTTSTRAEGWIAVHS